MPVGSPPANTFFSGYIYPVYILFVSGFILDSTHLLCFVVCFALASVYNVCEELKEVHVAHSFCLFRAVLLFYILSLFFYTI